LSGADGMVKGGREAVFEPPIFGRLGKPDDAWVSAYSIELLALCR
jgi:hypothetical protein